MANLSQEKRQRMLAFLETIREEHKDDDEVLIALGEIESELNAKKYGLVWERHEEAVDVQMRDNIPVFTECADKEITTTTGGVNFLLEGDNLHSLRLLEKTHTGKIDVIYIDPPYTTENKDFIYDDAFVDKNDGFRHSKWLSFMNERLQIAKKLLSSSGVLIISIGYHEVHNLMVICQEMFENKQVTCVTVQTSGGKPNGGFTFLQEYIREEHKDDDEVLIALGEIESELNAKKYGLVWERHEEAVDVQMRDNIPVFTECADKEITTTTGGVNFLLEGDNLHSLRLLEKTHAGKIDVIYIDPPYNTENKDFIYDDAFVDKNDGFRHSKWLSFMNERLQIAKRLLSSSGVLIISIGYHEVHNLMVMCQEMFENKQVTCVTVQTSGGKPNGGFTFLQEYLVFITPTDFNPKTMSFTGGIERSPFEGLTLSTFDKTTRPNQTYPIFIDRETMHIIGVGKSLTERIAEGCSPFEGLTLSTFDKTTRPNQTYPIFIDRETMHIIGVGKSLTERIAEG